MRDPDDGFVEISGARLYHEAQGEGPALTLIHAGVAHLRMWDEQVPAWRDHFRVIRYDTRGFGRTETEDVPYSNVDDLRMLLDELGVSSTHLLGISRGSMIALDFTLAHPERVRSLIWVAGGVRGLDVEDDPRVAPLEERLEKLEQEHNWEELVELETQIWTDGPGQPRDRVAPELRRRMIGWNMQNYLAEQPADKAVAAPSAAEHLADIEAPTLAIWGTLDESTVDAAGRHLVATVPNARQEVFEGVAHMVNLERPDQFSRLVLDFLLEVEAQAPPG